jgi:hypothetical protein
MLNDVPDLVVECIEGISKAVRVNAHSLAGASYLKGWCGTEDPPTFDDKIGQVFVVLSIEDRRDFIVKAEEKGLMVEL